MPTDSCTISIADDGEVGFLVSNPDIAFGHPCEVRLTGPVLALLQKGVELVRVEDVSDDFVAAIRRAPGFCMINILEAGSPGERMVVNRQISLAQEHRQ